VSAANQTGAAATRRRSAVDVAAVLDLVGALLKWFALTFLLPVLIALGYGDPAWPFLVAGAAAGIAGLLLDRLSPPGEAERLRPREGFLAVALIWLIVPAFGALPYLLGGGPQLDRPLDAYFEAVSGFTATGATVLYDIPALDHAMLFWRQLSHWLGGMGIIILAIAVLPRLRIGGRQLLQRELPGPTEIERLTATIRETARRLWTLYVGLSLVAILVLCVIGWVGLDPAMTPFQAFAHATSAMALGGFSTKQHSIAAFAPITQWVLCGVMVLAGVNFLRLHRLIVERRPRLLARDQELRLYLAFLVIGATLIAVELFSTGSAPGLGNGIREASIQAVSIMTTTGFASADYTLWGPLAIMTLLLLMFVGASAGSTGGSIKVVRHLLLFRVVRREVRQTIHPEAVVPIRVSGRLIDERAIRSAITFVLLYVLVFALGAIGLLLDARRVGADLSAFDAIGAAAACIGNVGPSFGATGPFGSYAGLSDLSTTILTALMWLGRIEIIPVAVVLTRGYWRS